MSLVSNRSQKTSKRGENISDTLACSSYSTSLFLPQLDDICDQIQNRRTATWNLFVKRDNNVKIWLKQWRYSELPQQILRNPLLIWCHLWYGYWITKKQKNSIEDLKAHCLYLVLYNASYWSLSKHPIISFIPLSLPKQRHWREVTGVNIDIQSANGCSFHMMPELQAYTGAVGWIKWLADEIRNITRLTWEWCLNEHIAACKMKMGWIKNHTHQEKVLIKCLQLQLNWQC